MKCPACSHENRAGAKFCEECAAPLKRACASCGGELRPTAKFCDECGAPTAAAAPAVAGARKIVTVVFADLVGSTALHERLDAESARGLMERYYAVLRTAVQSHGGTVVKLLGDGVMAAFGVPQVAEDDAIRAVRAGMAMQEAFRELAGEPDTALAGATLRVAVNTGEVVVSGRNDDVIGDPVNVAARLQQEAGAGDVVIGQDTERLVSTLVTLEPLGSFALKGRSESVNAYRVVSLERPAGATTTPFVGRDDELTRITRVYDAAVAAPAARLAVLLGSPGLGKSRLIDEFARRLGGKATIVKAHCDAAGGATFAPIADAVRKLVGVDDGTSGDALRAAIERAALRDDLEPTAAGGEDTERSRIVTGIASLLAGSAASPEETFSVVRRFLAILAATRPVVLVIDDLHWAEPLLLDLVEHLVQWGTGTRLFVLVSGRPELRDARSSLATPGGVVTDVVTLGGLDAGAAMRLAANVIGAADLPAAVAAKVLAASEGNPLFVGELIRMLVHEGVLEKQGERWTVAADVTALEMPPTIHALLAARIEKLRPEDRIVLEHAAVVGRHFSRAAVAELLPRDVIDLDARLEALRRSELIERDVGWFLGEPVLRFHHVLIRDAAYRRLLKNTRAELHGRFAEWVEGRAGDAIEHDETIGWHLEQAHQLLGELGPLDDRGRTLGERAARRLAAAGRRALARDDVALSANLLGRAIARLEPGDSARADLALDWCESLLAAGDVGAAAAAIDELGRFIAGSERLGAWHTCFAGQLTALTAPEALHATADSVATAAQKLASLGDAAGEAKAHFVHAQALSRLGKVGAGEAALDRALAAARKAGDRRRANAVLAGAPVAALWGPSPVTRASGRCLDVVRVLRITQGAPAVEAVALSCQGVLEALRGRTDAARRMIASSRKMVEELGITHRLFDVDVFAARVDLLEGDAASAERTLRGAHEGLRALGLGIDAARAAALLARALLVQGRGDDAEAFSHESEKLAGDDLQAAIAWRVVRAEALARRGETKAAVELAQAAVAIASATDALLDHADARLALAAALGAAGRKVEADAEKRRALELWQTKGATLLAERAPKIGGRVDTAEASGREAAPTRVDAAVAQTKRLLRGNAASALRARFAAVVAAGDLAAVSELFRDDFLEIDHTTGASYGRDGVRTSTEKLLRSESPVHRCETLGTLGDFLSLDRRWTGARATGLHRIDVGEYETEKLSILEVDPSGRAVRQELFATDRLGEAVARIFERYAELAPPGVERKRAEATARSIAAVMELGKRFDPERIVGQLSDTITLLDYRTLSLPHARGIDEIMRVMRGLNELADETSWLLDDVLALAPNGLVGHGTGRGIDRVSGGRFEMPAIAIEVCGDDGLLTHWEAFDTDRKAEALARFERLTGGARREPGADRRRLRANAATAATERLVAAVVARDEAAYARSISESLRTVDHPNGVTYGCDGLLDSLRRFLSTPNPRMEIEPLATLGDSLSLSRYVVASSGTSGPLLDVAEWERHTLMLCEVDATGRIGQFEIFASENMGEALIRLYEKYADTLPPGTAKRRAQVVARSMSVIRHGFDPDELSIVLAPQSEAYDHRTVGFGSLHGLEAMRSALRALVELSERITWQVQEVVAANANAVLQRVYSTGNLRAGGGSFERQTLWLVVFGDTGLVTRFEQFDVEQRELALKRYDELIAGVEGRREAIASADRFRNAATRVNERIARAWSERNWEAVLAQHGTDVYLDDRRSLMQMKLTDAQGFEQLHFLFDVPGSRWSMTPLATRGERIALSRCVYEGNVDPDGGALAIDYLVVDEVDDSGLSIAVIMFDPDALDAAYAELDARFYAGLTEQHRQSASVLQRFRDGLAARDLIEIAARCTPDIVAEDHRLVSWGTLRGREEYPKALLRLLELAPDTRLRLDHVRLRTRGLMWQGSWLGTREGGEFEIPVVVVAELDANGLQCRMDVYDVSHVDEAWARLDAIDAKPTIAQVFANAATRFNEKVTAAWAARDWDAIARLHAPNAYTDDRRQLMRLESSGSTNLEQLRFLFEVPGARWHVTPIATRGERLSLSRCVYEGNVDSEGGHFAMDLLIIDEVDAEGRNIAAICFDPDDLDAAYAELDARYDAREGAPPDVTTSAFQRAVMARDWDAVTALPAPDLKYHDHCSLSMLGTTVGADAWVTALRALVDLAPDSKNRLLHIRWVGPACIWQFTWEGSRDGGRYEIPYVGVSERDDRGRLTRVDMYDPEQLDQAIARFDEAKGALEHKSYFANAASQALDRTVRAFNGRDWAAMVATFAPTHRMDDRRRLMRIEVAGEDFLENERLLFEVPGSAWRFDLVATRGERLALCRVQFTAGGESDAGPMAVEMLDLVEVDEAGRRTAMVVFDPDDLEGAYAELDARYDAGEARPFEHRARFEKKFSAAFASRDWDALAAVFAPTLVAYDHRLVGWGTVRGPQGIVGTLRAMVELAPDAHMRADHLRVSEHASLGESVWVGTRDGGAFESPYLSVIEFDAAGAQRIDFYDPHHLAEARARFEEIEKSRGKSGKRFANAATRAMEIVLARFATPEREDVEATLDPSFEFHDRRRIVRVKATREDFLAGHRMLLEVPNADWNLSLLATRGERLALYRVGFTGNAAEGGGPLALDDHLGLIELGPKGLFTALVLRDIDELDAAYAELEQRFDAGEASEYRQLEIQRHIFPDALARRDWRAVEACFAPEIAAHDHRLASWGSVHGPAPLVRTMRSMIDLAPDVRLRTDHVRVCALGALVESVWVGTHEGGLFESASVSTTELSGDGKIRCIHFYDPRHLDAALARFEEIRARREASAVPAGASVEARMHRFQAALGAAIATGNWDGVRQGCSADFVFEDRRRIARLKGDIELMLASLRERVAIGARARPRVLGTAGDRVVLFMTLWSGGPTDGRFEIEFINLAELDESGLLRANILFDVDDLPAAQREAFARWAITDPNAPESAARLVDLTDAFDAQDRARFRACLVDDLVVEDHRHAGQGHLVGADAYVDSIAVLWKLAPKQRSALGLTWHAHAKHGGVTGIGRKGTLPDGGEFESEYLMLFTTAQGRFTRFEYFELDDLAAALARFEELRPDPLRISPNAATRALDQIREAYSTRDWAHMRSLAAPGFVFDDRGRRALVAGDIETWIGGLRFAASAPSANMSCSLIATLGDRIAVERVVWTGRPDAAAFEIDRIRVVETDANGLLRTALLFDSEDRADAAREALKLYAAGEGAKYDAVAVACSCFDSLSRRDWETARSLFSPTFRNVDRRVLGFPTLDRDGSLASVKALAELSSDWTPETLRVIAVSEHGTITVNHNLGTVPEGGQFENVFIMVHLVVSGRIERWEIFDVVDVDRAIARFEELRPDPLRIPPNAATRAYDRFVAYVDVGDWDAVRKLCAPIVFSDRRRLFLSSADCEGFTAGVRYFRDAGVRPQNTVLALGTDRSVLQRNVYTVQSDGHDSVIETLEVVEVDEQGRIVAYDVFDPEDRRAASIALGQRVRYDAIPSWGGKVYRAMNARDAAGLREALPNDFVIRDLRRTGFGTIEGADAYMRAITAMYELSPDVVSETVYDAAVEKHGLVSVCRRFGTNTEGGVFEALFVALVLYGEGRVAEIEVYEIEDLERAKARLVELRPHPLGVVPTAATRAVDRTTAALVSRNWDVVRTLVSDDFVYEDRSKQSLVSGGVEELIASARYLFSELAMTASGEFLGTVGDRVVVYRRAWSTGAGAGASTIEKILVHEVDAAEKSRVLLRFDHDDRGSAFAEAHERFSTNEAKGVPAQDVLTAVWRAWATRDWPALRKLVAEDAEIQDRRLLGFGQLAQSDWIEWWRVGGELAPDRHGETVRILAWNKHGRVSLQRVLGTRDGGAFESLFIVVAIVSGGAVRRYEVFDADRADDALARFGELQPDALSIPPNAATRALDRMRTALRARDWDALRAIAGPGFTFEDRSKRALVSGDADTWVASLKFLTTSGVATDVEGVFELLATVGDRIAITRRMWRAGSSSAPVEIDKVAIMETDEGGRLRAVVLFDGDDRSAAFAEAHARFSANEAHA